MKLTSLKDIAEKANVDISTVSRALANSPVVKEETKQRIFAMAKELGYYPHASARALASRRSHTVGLILPDMKALQGPFYIEVLRGIEQKTNESDYSLLLTTMANKDKESIYLSLINGRRMDGVLLISENITIEELPFLVKENINFVVVNRFFKGPHINCVASDNIQGAKLATAHLISLGHKRIGFVTGQKSFSASCERIEGYKQALGERNLPFDESLLVEGSFQNGISSGYKCTLELLLNRSPRPTAIFAANDEIAVGVFQALRDKNIKIPQEMAVVGFDDAQFAAYLTPPLTTIKQYSYEIGFGACEMLIKLLNKEPVGTHKIKIPTKLVIRDSCGSKLKNPHSSK